MFTIDIGPIGPLAVKGGNKSAQSARWQLKNTSIGQIGLWQTGRLGRFVATFNCQGADWADINSDLYILH
jgi:hypothetical protein